MARRLVENFVAKSGGNTYHGKIYVDYQNGDIQSKEHPGHVDSPLCPGGRCGNLQPSDLNRMESYHDVNGDIGGFIKKDKLSWYFSARDQNIKSLLPNFPVKAFETGLRNLTGKATYALNQNNKITGYAQGGKKLQPNGSTVPVGALAGSARERDHSTWRQEYWGHTYKAGWDSVINDKMFFEVRGGQFKYEWPNFRLTEELAFQDLGDQSGARRKPRRVVQHPLPGTGSSAGWATSRKAGAAATTSRSVASDTERPLLSFAAPMVRVMCQVMSLHILNNGAPFRSSCSRRRRFLKTACAPPACSCRIPGRSTHG